MLRELGDPDTFDLGQRSRNKQHLYSSGRPTTVSQ